MTPQGGSLLYIGYLLSFPGVKWPGRGVQHPPHLAPRLKKEKSFTSTPPLGLRSLFWGELYLYPYLSDFWHLSYMVIGSNSSPVRVLCLCVWIYVTCCCGGNNLLRLLAYGSRGCFCCYCHRVKTQLQLIIIIIIINIKDWTLWSVPSPELQLLAPMLLRSSNCSPSLWSLVVWFQRDSVLWHPLQVLKPVPSVFLYRV